MVPCPSCGTHLRGRDRACFSCGAAVSASFPRTSAAALLLGLSVACTGTTGTKTDSAAPTGDTGTTQMPLYGASPTDTAEEEHTGTFTSGVDYGTSPTYEHSGDTGGGSGHSGAR